MSDQGHYERWLKIKPQIPQNIEEDLHIEYLARDLVGLKPQATAVEIVARVYAKYCDIYNKLCEVYDQMVQAQRRDYLKKIIDAITCRIIEIKNLLEEVEVFQYTYPDNALQQMVMVPQDMEIICPFFYPFEIREQEMQYIVTEILAGNRLGDPTPSPSEMERLEEERLELERIAKEEKDAEINRKLAMGEDIVEEVEIILSPKEIEELRLKEEYETKINNIQRMVRSSNVMKKKVEKRTKDINLYLELAGLKQPPARESLRKKAANSIMNVYREFMKLKREHQRVTKLKEKLGMTVSAYTPPSQKLQLEKVKEARRKFRHEFYEKWLKANVKENDRVFRLREGDIMQDISDEIRQWWQDCYKHVRVFDDFPYPDEGGSILLARGEVFTMHEFIEWQIAEEKRLKAEEKSPKSKEDIKNEKLAEKEEKKRLAEEAREKEKKRISDYKKQRMNPLADPGVYYDTGTQIESVENAWFSYENLWGAIDTRDASLDVMRGHIMQLITECAYEKMQFQLRPIVDEVMKLELVLLRNALKLDFSRVELPVPLYKKRKRPKKVKPPKPDKTRPAIVFQQLVDEGIVRKYPHITLDDYWGDRNFAAADMRAVLWTPSFPEPTVGDVQELVRVKCLLALGSTCSNAKRAQLIVGPKKCGKKSLVYAIATETNSILIDLSPMNIYNKFPGAKGLKTMLTLVNKVSRFMQPAIILVENVDKLFYKKVPKEEKEFDPTRLSKDFVKDLIKPLRPQDRIMILGTASEPWLANNNKMGKAFSQVILVPRTDYASLSFILTKLLMKYHGIDREFDVHSLAQALRGYDIDSIKKAIETVLNGKRVASLTYNPLKPVEIVYAVLDNREAVYTDKEDYDMFKQWYYAFTPWGPKFTFYMEMLESQFTVKTKLDKQKKKK